MDAGVVIWERLAEVLDGSLQVCTNGLTVWSARRRSHAWTLHGVVVLKLHTPVRVRLQDGLRRIDENPQKELSVWMGFDGLAHLVICYRPVVRPLKCGPAHAFALGTEEAMRNADFNQFHARVGNGSQRRGVRLAGARTGPVEVEARRNWLPVHMYLRTRGGRPHAHLKLG